MFSRQRYWGEPIPVIHWEDGSMTTVPEEELPLLLPETDEIKPSGTGESPLANIDEFVKITGIGSPQYLCLLNNQSLSL